MSEKEITTANGAKLSLEKEIDGGNINWIFIPGGAGLGSEYLKSLIDPLNTPGSYWRLDLPADDYEKWTDILFEVVEALPNCALIGHSFGGMLALQIPQLEHKVLALITIGSALDSSFIQRLEELVETKGLPQPTQALEPFLFTPNLETMKSAFEILTPYYFTDANIEKGKALFANTAMDPKAFHWYLMRFFPQYELKWIPDSVPTLMLCGEKDYIQQYNDVKADSRLSKPNVNIAAIPEAAHFPWIENSSATTELLDSFMAKIKATS